ncbi:MAG: hypothetical protein IKX61_03360, partial [Prevotella sp.]|nr:hypothetical protein [Prevotella sp.]
MMKYNNGGRRSLRPLFYFVHPPFYFVRPACYSERPPENPDGNGKKATFKRMCVDYNAIVTFLSLFLFLHFICTIFVPVILSSTNTFGTSPFDMKRTLILILALVAALSARGQEAVGQKEKYYLGAEASVGGEIAACIVGGVCFSGVDVKLHVLFPLGTKGIAYYNLPIRYGRSREMELMPGNGIELVAGY